AERALAAVGRLEAGEDAQEGGLPGAVGPHQPHLVPLEEPERQPLEEGPGAVRLAHPLTAQKKRTGHARLLLLLLRLLLLLLHAPALGHVLTSLPGSRRSCDHARPPSARC